MDQSKFKCPRIREQQSKLFSRLFRPTLHVAGVWLHGRVLNLYVSDDSLCKDSQTQMEMFTRTISSVCDSGDRLAAGLAVQQDNTYREGKNQYVMSWLCLLVCLRVYRFTVANYLRKGHSALIAQDVLVFDWCLLGRSVAGLCPHSLIHAALRS